MRLVPEVRRDVRAHPGDYGLAGAMAVVAIVALVSRIDVQDVDAYRFHPDTWWAWTDTVGICALLIGRRRWPLRTLACGLVLVLPLELARQRDVVAFFAVVIALYSVAAHLPPRLAWRGPVLVAALYAVLVASGTVILSPAPVLGPGFLATAFALGMAIQHSRTRQRREVDGAIDRAVAATETDDLRAADERLRLARELHDVVAHSLSVIAVQAGIGAHLIDRQPAQAASALDAISATCATTDGELSRLVALLRHGGAAAATPPAIADVAVLVDQIRAAGVAVALDTGGDLAAVPDGVSLAAYRIVQEALTNVVRHAGPAAANVTIEAAATRIDLLIDDDGRGATGPASGARPDGNGLLGMSERARMYGGAVEAGPRPGGGFRVRATLRTGTGFSPVPASVDPPGEHDVQPGRRRFASSAWDAALALVMAALAMIEVAATDPTATGPPFTPTHLWALSLRLGCSATLAVRRRHPGIAYTAAWLPALTLIIGDYQFGVTIFVLWIGLYSVAAYAPRWQLIAAAAGSSAGLMIVAWSRPPDLTGAGAAWAAVFFAASAVAGHVVRRNRDQHDAELGERANAASARTRHAHLVLATERLRMADELSTIIARAVHTIARRAATGSQLVHTDTSAARDALQAISRISRDALNDLRLLLTHMRTTPTPTPDPVGPRR